jgi:hypothetical protein
MPEVNPAGASAYLRRFQETGDTQDLARYVRLSGGDGARYRTAIELLGPVFEPLGHGEYPRYGDLDRQGMRGHEAEMRSIAGWMAASEKADLRGAGTALLGLLDAKN